MNDEPPYPESDGPRSRAGGAGLVILIVGGLVLVPVLILGCAGAGAFFYYLRAQPMRKARVEEMMARDMAEKAAHDAEHEARMVRARNGAPDRELIEAVRNAAIRARTGKEAEMLVGRMPAFDRVPARDYALDPDETSEVSLEEIRMAREVMFWSRPIDGNVPRVVGICFMPNGTRKMAFCVVLTPEK